MRIRQRIFLSHLALVSIFLVFLGSYVAIGVVRTQTDSDLTRLYRVKSSWGDMLMSMNNIVNNWDDGRSFSLFLKRLDDFQTELTKLHTTGRLRFYYSDNLRSHIDSLYKIWTLAQDNISEIVAGIDASDFQRVVQQITREPGLQRLNHLWVSLFYTGTEAQRTDAYAVRQVLDAIEFFPIYSDTMTRQFDVIVSGTTEVYNRVVHVQLALSLSFFVLFLLGYFTFSALFTRSISRPITDLSLKLTAFIGHSIDRSRRDHKDELELLANSVSTLIEHYTYLSKVARRLAEGDIESSSFDIPERGVVGNALNEVSSYLRRLAQVSTWIRDGNYGAEVDVASEKDVLGRSFNIMSREIHERITTLSRVFDAMDQAILVVAVDGSVVESNNRLLRLLDVESIQKIEATGGLEQYIKDYSRIHKRLVADKWKENRPAVMVSARGAKVPVRITARFLEPMKGQKDKIMLFISNESWKVRMRREKERLKAQAVLAELKALRAQINPHFFFNTLNTIVQLIETDPDHAVRTTEKLADLFRYAMATTERETVAISEELKHVRQFLQIEQTRFEESLHVDFEIEESVETERIPPMLLQPIVENALRHGKEVTGQVNLSIRARWEEDDILFQIADTGETSDTQNFFNGRGIGLKNVNNRLRTLYGSTIQLDRNSPKGVVVSLRIPAGRHGD